jgi:hypothetical protein
VTKLRWPRVERDGQMRLLKIVDSQTNESEVVQYIFDSERTFAIEGRVSLKGVSVCLLHDNTDDGDDSHSASRAVALEIAQTTPYYRGNRRARCSHGHNRSRSFVSIQDRVIDAQSITRHLKLKAPQFPLLSSLIGKRGILFEEWKESSVVC